MFKTNWIIKKILLSISFCVAGYYLVDFSVSIIWCWPLVAEADIQYIEIVSLQENKNIFFALQ